MAAGGLRSSNQAHEPLQCCDSNVNINIIDSVACVQVAKSFINPVCA